MASPTLRSLARALGLSHATVSSALNGRGRVRPETVQSVRALAEAVGYRSNPLTSAVMSEVRRSRNHSFRGTVATVELGEPDRPACAQRYHAEVVRGVAERGASLGFKVESFVLGPQGVPMHRLDAILRARGIRGIVLLPAWNEPDVSRLDWNHYLGVYTDYVIERPALPSVYPDHHRAMMMVLQHLRSLGYRRPGLFVVPHQDERIQYRWEAAFLASAANSGGLARVLPRLKSCGLNREEFIQWFREYEPDVVLGHDTEAIGWMEAAGAEIPATHGFVCLNLLMRKVPCAGLDLQPALIGSLALEQLVAQLHRNEFGSAPRVAPAISVPPQWIHGPTVRRLDRTDRSVDPAVLPFPIRGPSAPWLRPTELIGGPDELFSIRAHCDTRPVSPLRTQPQYTNL